MTNKRFQGVMLVTDMDGTLLNSSKLVSPENRSAIERFVGQGGTFTLATGRITSSVQRFADQLPLNAPAILYNGAVIHDFASGRNVWERTLDRSSVQPVVERLMMQFPELGVEVYCGEAPYFIRENPTTERHRNNENFMRPVQTDGFDSLTGQWFKVLLAWEPARLDELQEFVARHEQAADVSWVRSDDKYFEILPPGATKGHALEQLLELTGIERSRCIAMGDHLNDLELLRRAGVGIAVANAHEQLISVSNRSCKHHDDHAVADVIEWLEREG
jgi:Cof subfamily protein (haloacid dehalogenase superfamily)